ncbi:MAG: HD domain-containing protein [Candidatus Thermoplasmatota archaeon]|nr:HD domain-containing protein [Candidatus Thermoplasmatota archaeon]
MSSLSPRYQKIWERVKDELSSSSHGIDHTGRVYRLSKTLADDETERDVLTPAALLHDIAREKEDSDQTGEIDHARLGAEMAEEILIQNGFDEQKIERIKHCILTHRYRSGKRPKTKEAKILSDADKLDAIGAVGIARSFIVAGEYDEVLYRDVDVEYYAQDNLTEEGRVIEVQKHAPNLEYELKLKKIKERLFTDKAKRIGKERQEFMESFFRRLKREIEGKK